MATVRELLDVGIARLRDAGSDSPRLDAELLLGFALDQDRTSIIAHTDAPVGDGAAARFEATLDRRAAGEPVAYIRGVKEFHGLAFGVDPRALIRRAPADRRATRPGRRADPNRRRRRRERSGDRDPRGPAPPPEDAR
jgi:methylase of polypeptide subunit release factors